MSSSEDTFAVVRDFLEEADIEWELGAREGELVVTLPGEKKLKTVCSVVVGQQSLMLSAFVVRNPYENHLAVYRTLLRRNLRLPGLSYGIDGSGDIYVQGRVPLAGVDPTYLDQFFGVVLDASDGAFNELLALGFLDSMKKEWDWRISRGESTRNLEAFRHLLDGTERRRQREDPSEARPAAPRSATKGTERRRQREDTSEARPAAPRSATKETERETRD